MYDLEKMKRTSELRENFKTLLKSPLTSRESAFESMQLLCGLHTWAQIDYEERYKPTVAIYALGGCDGSIEPRSVEALQSLTEVRALTLYRDVCKKCHNRSAMLGARVSMWIDAYTRLDIWCDRFTYVHSAATKQEVDIEAQLKEKPPCDNYVHIVEGV